MRKDHRGITLVELLIAIAISSIIVAAAAFFLMTAQKNYREASASIDLQSESQILMEQLGTWIMEGNRIKTESTDGGTSQNVLVIYKIPRKITTALPDGVIRPDTAEKRVIWKSASDKHLYMKKVQGISDPDLDTTDLSMLAGEESKETLIGEYVTDFQVNVDDSKVGIALNMAQSKETYEIQNDFKVRNELK